MSSLTRPAEAAPAAGSAPSAGLLASLGVRTWLEASDDGRPFAPLLLTHPPALRDEEDSQVIEERMHCVAAFLGLRVPSSLVPDSGPRIVMLSRGGALLRFDGTTYSMRLPIHGHCATVFARLGQVLLAVGLDPLSRGASNMAVDSYVRVSVAAGQMRFGSAGVIPVREARGRVHTSR